MENDVFKQDWRSRSKIQIFQYTSLKWCLCFVVGTFVGLIGFFNNLAIENIAGIKFVITSNRMLENKLDFFLNLTFQLVEEIDFLDWIFNAFVTDTQKHISYLQLQI